MRRQAAQLLPDTLLGRVLGLLLTVALVALGFVLLAAALVLGGLLALAAIGRLAWARWKADREDRRGTIEAEYRVDPPGSDRGDDGSRPVLEGELIVEPEDEEG